MRISFEATFKKWEKNGQNQKCFSTQAKNVAHNAIFKESSKWSKNTATFFLWNVYRQSKITKLKHAHIKWKDTKYANNEYDQRDKEMEEKKIDVTRSPLCRKKNDSTFVTKIYHNDENE